eukprot:1284194-Heterocapsa_arctica.AAC.1
MIVIVGSSNTSNSGGASRRGGRAGQGGDCLPGAPPRRQKCFPPAPSLSGLSGSCAARVYDYDYYYV